MTTGAEPGRVIPGTYRTTKPTPVWLLNYGEHPRPALLVAWRRQVANDRRAYWYGYVVMAQMVGDQLETRARWACELHMRVAEMPRAARPSRSG